LSVAPPATHVRTVNVSLRYLRPCTVENEAVIARGRVLHAGSSFTLMIDRHYGHLARDGREHAIRLLDSSGELDVHRVDARWTSRRFAAAPWKRQITPQAGEKLEARSRTRTDDPFLTSGLRVLAAVRDFRLLARISQLKAGIHLRLFADVVLPNPLPI